MTIICRPSATLWPLLLSKFAPAPLIPTTPWSLATAKSLRSCPTLCDPIDGSPPGSTIPGILQARTLEWVAISLSNASKWKVKVKLLSRVQLFTTPWTAAYQAPPSMGCSKQEYWSGLPLPSPIILFTLPLISFHSPWLICYFPLQPVSRPISIMRFS